MKHRLLFICMTILIWSVKPLVAKGNLMVVPGRTWWYQSGVTKVIDELLRGIPVNIGLTIGDNAPEEWMPCYAIDAEGDFTIPQPLAHLKESDGKVWIRPNLKLYEISGEIDVDIYKIFRYFLGYWDGNYITGILNPACPPHDAENYLWNKDPVREEFLLYDFNASVGFKYEWPWAGTNMIKDDYTEETYEDIGFFVEKAEEGEDSRKVYEINQKIKTTSYMSGRGKVVEGIGLIESDFISYSEFCFLQTSFFVSPASIQAPPTTGFFDPAPPMLMNVREADGTCIYGDESFHASISEMVSEPSPASNKIFDLHGREVSNPLPGSIYIRNGKKFVAK